MEITQGSRIVQWRHIGVYLYIAVLCLLASNMTQAAVSYDPSLHWQTLETSHFQVHFHDGEEALARQAASIAEQTHEQLRPYFNWTPAKRTDIILSDRVDFANGWATPLPGNRSAIYVSPPDDIAVLSDFDDWLRLVITHEYTHILHLDKVAGSVAAGRNLFGRMLLTFPNVFQPDWVQEGLATYLESDAERGVGRGYSSYFRMLMRLQVVQGVKPLSEVNQPIDTWPASATRYLYGVYFFKFLHAQYGEAKIQQWIEAYSDHWVPYLMNSTASEVFGKDMDALWGEYQQWLAAQFRPEITALGNPRQGETLTQSGYDSGFARVLDNGELFYIESDQRSEKRLMWRPAAGAAQQIAELRSDRFDADAKQGILLAQVDLLDNSNLFYDLYRLDPHSQRMRRLTHAGRYHFAAWYGERIIAVQQANGQSALQLLDGDGHRLETLWQGSQGEILSQIDVSGEQLVAAIWRPGLRWNVELFDLGSRQWSVLAQSPSNEGQPQFSADGRFVVFSSDAGGVYNIHRIELASNTHSRLTQVLGGAFNPALGSDGRLYYNHMGANGSDLYQWSPGVGSPEAPIALNPKIATPPTPHSGEFRPYSPADSLQPTWWFPAWQFTPQRSEIGLITSGQDVLARHSYMLYPLLDFKNRWLSGAIQYSYDRWNPMLKLSLERMHSEYLNDQQQLQRFRRNDLFTLEAIWPILHYQRQWSFHVGAVFDREADARLGMGAASLPADRDHLLGLALTSNSARRYPISIHAKHGNRLQLVAENSDRLGGDYRGSRLRGDAQALIGIGEQQVLAFRLASGWASAEAKPFQLGGANSNAIITPVNSLALPSTALFGRRRFALRGYPEGLSSLRGQRFWLSTVQWHFPVARIQRGWSAPPIGLQQIHASLFADSGAAGQRMHHAVGAELTSEITLGYKLPLDLTIGLAQGLQDDGEGQFYLRLSLSP